VSTTTKKELVNRIAEKTGQTKVIAKEIIQMFLDEIIRELGEGNRLEFREFGVFEIRERAARRAQNPRTLQKVNVPAKRVVKFKVGRLMRQLVSTNDGDDEDYDDDADGKEVRAARARKTVRPSPSSTAGPSPSPTPGS
jgi:integration host factor subunit beta